MSGERLEVSVTFEPAKGYVATVPDLAEPITALSLAGLRRRIEERLLPDVPARSVTWGSWQMATDPVIVLHNFAYAGEQN